jgi:hypothetical protein
MAKSSWHKIANAKEVLNFLCANLFDHLESSYLGKKRPICWVFWHIVSKHIDRNFGIFAYNTLEGTQKFIISLLLIITF